MQLERVISEVEKLQDEIVQTLMDFIRIPAIGPENGGDGESNKAEKLMQLLEHVGFDKVERYDAQDDRVSSKTRPNIAAYLYGKEPAERLWIVTHMDIVPPGEESLWTISRPFEPIVKEGRIYGRGSEDNMHSMMASIFALKALKNAGVKPKRTVALAFVSDEEHGNKYGIQHLLNTGVFRSEDLVVVPDSGLPDGSFIEISEKGALWLKITTVGKQTHASRPDLGLNAHRIAMEYALALDKSLHERYSMKDSSFDPPGSTIEPTKKDKNVDAINIVPGEDVLYFDLRILPNYDLENILGDAKALAADFERKTGATITIETVQRTDAPKPTSADAKVVLMLQQALRDVRGIASRTGGVGGGTCAAYFRKAGIPAVVWSTVDETAHQPNEYTKTANLINDTKVYAYMAIS